MVALLTAGLLLLAWIFKLGFLADFLSQTVLVGFLTGVGFQVGIAMFGEMLGVPVNSNRTVEQLAQVVHGLPQFHVPTLCVAGVVVMIVLVFRRFAPRLPGPLFAVVAAIAASAALDFSAHGIVLIERLSDVIGADHIFDTLHEALEAIRGQRVHAVPISNPLD
jgi:sulfate permease, SulP family